MVGEHFLKVEIIRAVWSVTLCFVTAAIRAQGVYVDAPEAAPSENADPGFSYFVGQQITADSNLFRLPSGDANVLTAAGESAKKGDSIDTTSLGLTELWVGGRQTVAANLRMSHDAYGSYRFLDNTALSAHLTWNWTAGSRWTGQFAINHDRSLLDFAYTRELAKDIIKSDSYVAGTRFQLGPDWALTSAFHAEDINHSLVQSAVFDSRNNFGSFGVEYSISSSNTIEVQYKYSAAKYPDEVASLVLIRQDFHASTTQLLVFFSPSDKTAFVANAGYLKRQYSDSQLPSYSGDVWHAAFDWQASQKLHLIVAAGRDLEAYVDAATEYFIAKETTIKINWNPRAKLTFSLLAGWENQEYIAAAGADQGLLGRLDTLKSQSFTAEYSPRSWASLNLSVGLKERSSNFAIYSFNDRYLTGGIRLIF